MLGSSRMVLAFRAQGSALAHTAGNVNPSNFLAMQGQQQGHRGARAHVQLPGTYSRACGDPDEPAGQCSQLQQERVTQVQRSGQSGGAVQEHKSGTLLQSCLAHAMSRPGLQCRCTAQVTVKQGAAGSCSRARRALLPASTAALSPACLYGAACMAIGQSIATAQAKQRCILNSTAC